MTITALPDRVSIWWPIGLQLVLLVDDRGTYAEWFADDDRGWPVVVGEA